MSPTRQGPHIQIYQDQTEVQPHSHLHPHPQMHAQPHIQPPPLQLNRPRPQLAPSAMPLQPTNRNAQVAFPPPMHMSKQHTPTLRSSYTAMPGEFNTMNMVPSMSQPELMPAFTDSPQKRTILPSSQPYIPPHIAACQAMHSQPPPQPMFASWDSNYQHYDQENFHVNMPLPANFVDFPDTSGMPRVPLKRSYSETVPSSDKPFKKGKTGPCQDSDEPITELPEPEDMPPVHDDGQKPPYSYATMIGMAILRAENRQLTLANIYQWIADTFAYYRGDPKTGWHNSIRHNLSLNKAFTKRERPKTDAGKGCYWVIVPGMEHLFFKDKTRKHNNVMPMQQAFSTQPMMQTMPQPVPEAMQPRGWIIQSQATMEAVPSIPHPRPQTAPALDIALPALSSDATLPASDPALNEEDIILSKEVPNPQPQSMAPPSSPPIINSSPPVVPRQHHRTISSPARTARPVHKRSQTTGNDDSGYFSSLESSARRPRLAGMVPTSELGFVPRRRVGRAEEEIVRIRSSSHDITPSGRRARRDAAEALRSSSPLQPNHSDLPATPPVIFKKPYLPPQSISPNTQLRRHREAMSAFVNDSPLKQSDPFSLEPGTYSPAFKLGTPGMSTSVVDENSFFDLSNAATPLCSSPIKPTMSGRPALMRSNTSAGILTDASSRANMRMNAKTPSKIPGNITLKAPLSTNYVGSPLKKSVTPKLDFFDDFNDENAKGLFDFTSFPEEASDEGEELDISKGFSKIGAASSSFPTLKPTLVKPGLARTHSSRF